MNKCFIGVDPGLGGAIAAICPDGTIEIASMPVAGKELDVSLILDYFEMLGEFDRIVYIEAVHSMPKQGVSSSFKFGFVTGIVHGIVRTLALPLYTVTPQAWKKEILAGTDKSKQASIDYCLRAYPSISLFRTERSRTYDDGMSDALLIAEYGKRRHENKS
jgi:hypothetical protein